MKLRIINWGDEAYQENNSSVLVAEIEIDKFTGFSYDGGRLDINGYSETIWVPGHQWSIEVSDDQ